MNFMSSFDTKNRIASVDGLRIVAVLGVIWAHIYLGIWFRRASLVIWISKLLMQKLGATLLTQNIVFVLSLIILIPFSFLSYHFLEAPYFRHRLAKATT